MIYHILVKPGSSKDEVVIANIPSHAQLADLGQSPIPEFIIRTRKKAHDGEANTAVIELLSKHFSVAKTRISIKSGATSRHKTIEIA